MRVLDSDFEIRTERLILRKPRREEARFVFDATRYPGFNDGMLWSPPSSVDELLSYYEESIRGWSDGSSYAFTLYLIDGDIPVGRIALGKSACDCSGWSTGFWTHPKHQCHGYMTEALTAVLELAFRDLEVTEVEACHADWNVASRRVMEKCGFKFRRHHAQGFEKNGEWVPEDVLGITKDQWKEVRKALG